MYSEALKLGVDPKDIDYIGHIMLSHHGRKEWGSPVLPGTTEAWAVHCADMMSAQYSYESKIPGDKRE